MHQPSTFQVYNASAGSGKTFTLVKEYLKVLLTTDDIFTFQKILAITFTNKAAAEMKTRVLESLELFADGKTNDLLDKILEETTLEKEIVKQRSQRILDAILQNYGAFSITTIDSFTHKIIKSFAFDLGLSLNFEVEMDAISLLNEAVDVLISKIGTDKDLTKLLIDYSLDKTDDDKSWDISRDLNEFAKILLNEDDVKHFKKLATKNLTDFFELKTKLKKTQLQIEKEFVDFAEDVLLFLAENGLTVADFSYGDYYKHFEKLKNFRFLKPTDFNFEGRLNSAIEQEKNLYPAKASSSVKQTIDGILPQLYDYYYQSKKLFEEKYPLYLLSKISLKSIIPLAVLNNINNELEQIKVDNNIRLNAEFNELISESIKEQPAPFIYERIGQRFQHFFIDEMQDTSVLQWQNLIPLINNALSQENAGLLLVGDGKQAIYRWRGGKAEQFINLGTKGQEHNPFLIEKNLSNLETNYRSFSEIINFNNSFFKHTANFLQNDLYKNLFIEGNKQEENNKKGGFVSLSFLEKSENKEEQDLRFATSTLSKIQELQHQFLLSEICVLTRTKKDGITIADYLAEKGIPIVSSETLLLKNNAKVNFIIDVLRFIQNPFDDETKFEILYFLHEHLQISSPKTAFLQEFIKVDIYQIFKKLSVFKVDFNLKIFNQQPLYEKIEHIIRGFALVNSSDAYIQFFLDVVLEQQKKGADVLDLLEFWELQQEKLSIVAQENANAVQIMTIHKSKGLEFPVVIFPCDVEIYRQINPKTWFDDLPESFKDFQELLIPYSKDLSLINNTGAQIVQQREEELELDNFNLLYVALTRTVEQLHIITDLKVNSKNEVKTFSQLFIDYLKTQNLWQEDKMIYDFGNQTRVSKKEEPNQNSKTHQKFISSPWQNHNLVLLASDSKFWNTEQGKAIDYGNLLHEIFAKITTKHDVDKVLIHFKNQGILDDQQFNSIQTLVTDVIHHPEIEQYFTEEYVIYNEREISTDNQIIIPDRLAFKENKVTIIDYKTAVPSLDHQYQINNYADVLSKMNFIIEKKLLIYINDNINIVKVP